MTDRRPQTQWKCSNPTSRPQLNSASRLIFGLPTRGTPLSPCGRGVAPSAARCRVRGPLRSPFELDQQVFQNGTRSLQHIVIPIAKYAKSLGSQSSVSDLIPLRSMLTSVDFHYDLAIEAHEIENVISKRHLPTEFETYEPPIAQEPPHLGFRVRRLAAHSTCGTADSAADGTMMCVVGH